MAAIVIILWSGLLVIPLFGFLKLVHKFRVPADIERKGIDIWKHGEDAYPLVFYKLFFQKYQLENFRWLMDMVGMKWKEILNK